MRMNPFEQVDAIFTQLHPGHAPQKKAPALEPDAPAKLRELWEATGVSEATGKLRTRAESEDELAQIFRDWAVAPVNRGAWGADAAAFRRALPERVRLVSKRSSAVVVTDESAGADDPPVLAMRADHSPLVRHHDRYTEWQIWTGLDRVASVRETKYFPHGSSNGRQILADVYRPGLYEIADRIWWLHMPPFARDLGVPVNSKPVIYASAREYLDFLVALPPDRQGLFGLPRGSNFEVRDPGPINLARQAPAGFRVCNSADFRRRETGWFHGIGRVGDTWVWLVMRENGELTVGFDPAGAEQVRAWLASQGVKVTGERPLTDATPGLSGW
jgi:hypothetical protein